MHRAYHLSSCSVEFLTDFFFFFRIKLDPFLNSNPEFQFSVTQLTKSMHAVHKAYGHMCESWQQRKMQLDQGISLRMFETDCQKVCDEWLHKLLHTAEP